jgi:hypothetical protein
MSEPNESEKHEPGLAALEAERVFDLRGGRALAVWGLPAGARLNSDG